MSECGIVRPKTRVLVVDDSAFMRVALTRMINCDPDLEVIASASSGSQALQQISELNPDVVTLDICMPGMDGLDILRCIMNEFPRPVIIVSAATEKGAETTLSALSAGAFDCVPKNLDPASLDITHIQPDLVAKIRAAAQSRASLSTRRKPPRRAESEPSQTRSVVPEVVAIEFQPADSKHWSRYYLDFRASSPCQFLLCNTCRLALPRHLPSV